MNRSLLHRVGALLAIVALLAGCDWAQYGFDGANTGHDLGATAFTTSSVVTLHQAWSASGPSPSPARLAVVGAGVYVAGSDAVNISIASPPPTPLPGPVEALESASGAVRWVVAGPTFSDNCLLAGESMTGPAVVAGKALFLTTTCGGFVLGHPVMGTSSATIDTATGAIGPSPTGYEQPPDGNPVVASDGSVYQSVDNPISFTGRLFPTNSTIVGPAGFGYTPDPSLPIGEGWRLATPAVGTHTVYAVGVGGPTANAEVLFAADRSTGAEAWRAVLPPGADPAFVPTPSVGNGRVFVSTGSQLLAFDPTGGAGCATVAGTTTCTPLWSVALPDTSTVEAPAISRHRVFVRSGTTLSAYRTDDGARLWTAPLGSGSGNLATLGPPSIAAGVAFVGTQDGRLLAFDATGTVGCAGTPVVCTPLWSAALSGATGPSRPVVAGDAVYISAANGAASTVAKFVL